MQMVYPPGIYNSDKKQGIKVELWFMVSNELVKIEVLKFLKISNSLFEKVALAAFLQMNIDDVEFLIKDKDAAIT